MPLIIIKMTSGKRTEDEKKEIVRTIADSLIGIGVDPAGLTIDVQEISKDDWEEKVKNIDITPRRQSLYMDHGVYRAE